MLNDDRADWREAWALFPGDVAYVWHGALHAATVAESLEASGFAVRAQIIWDKTRLVIGRGDYHWQHEPGWYAVRKGRKGHWAGDRKQTTVWAIPHRKSPTGHGTEKPVECMRRPIENNSSPGQAVYEPFSGSGTTIIAAEMTGRSCHAIELDPAYVDVAVTRWQDFTGQRSGAGGRRPDLCRDCCCKKWIRCMNRTELAGVWPPNHNVASRAGHKPMSPVEAIRRKCLDCSGGQATEVKLCEAVTCALWPFRAGRHPYTKTRLQEAISQPRALDGTPDAPNRLVIGNRPPGGLFRGKRGQQVLPLR